MPKVDAEGRCRDSNEPNAYVKRRNSHVLEPLLGLTLLAKFFTTPPRHSIGAAQPYARLRLL